MADVQHSAITDPDIHEPKGAAAASGDTVYVADGAGSGTWQKIADAQLNTAVETGILAQVETDILAGDIEILEAEVFMHIVIPDISSADTLLVPIPENAEVIQAQFVLEGAITVADATVTLDTAADAEIISQAIAFTGSGAGDSYVATPSGNATISGPSYLKLATDGGSTDAQRLFVTLHLYVERTIP